MPPIAAARSGQNIRRTCKLMNDISTSPTATSKTPSACGSGKHVQPVAPSHPKNSKLYKTELCRTWMDCGRCNYGDKCQYAHGEEERRPVSRHPKYKTEFCQPFHQVGYCPYGPRCNFIHNEEQPQSSLQTRRNQISNGNIKMNGGCCNSDSNGIATVAVAAATTTTATTTTTTATTTTTTTTTTKTTVTATSPATIKATAVTTTIATTTTVSTAGTTTTLTFGIWQPYCNSTGDSPAPSTVGSCSDSSIGSVSPSLDFDENMCSVVATANGWSTFGGKFNNNASFTVYCLNWPSTSAVATARATPLITQPLLDSTLFNDLLELTIDEKKKSNYHENS
ncbi:hypothetical protein DINM_022510 [Dirofilaria immitis]|nr:hypothetical protein [Dirofilaria immitis]